MPTQYLILGLLTALFVFGAYFIGLFRGHRHPVEAREFFASMARSLTWQGFAWSIALPTSWILLYYGFIAHIRLSLGRWPNFGEELHRWSLSWHYQVVWWFYGALVASLFVAAVVMISCVFFRRWRHVSVYALCYGAGVGLACAALFMAPGPFLNWLFD